MVKFLTGLSQESIVGIEGFVSIPAQSITGATQQVEIQVKKLYCVNKAIPTLPSNIEDAARSEAGEQLVRVNQDTRLNFRVLDMRTPDNQGIFRVQCQVENVLIASGSNNSNLPDDSTIDAPLAINVRSSKASTGGLTPSRRRSGWSEEEDMKFTAAVQKYGEPDWANIAEGDFKNGRSELELSKRADKGLVDQCGFCSLKER